MARHAKGDSQKIKTPVTLKDVAIAAGVTSMTVSKVVKGKGRISAATREKVLRVVEELNYTANPAARTLSTGRTGVIAIICESLAQAHSANTVHLLQAQLNGSGYEMKLLHTEGEVRDLINATKASAVDGVIVNGAHDLSEKPEFLNSQLAHRCVFLDTFAHPNTDYVRIDVREAVEEAIKCMIDVERKRIAYVGFSNNVEFDPAGAIEDRLKTYLAVMQREGRKVEFINSRQHIDMSRAERIGALREYFEIQGCPDGLICLHGDIAILAYRALRECGCRVPEDVSLVGCDDVPFMECFEPALSAIVHPMEEACALAWRFLEARINHPELPHQQTTIGAKLALRESLQLQSFLTPTK